MQQSKDLRPYLVRLGFSRMRILSKFPFYGLLLMHVTLGIEEDAETAYTDGDRIVFSPDFMDDLDDASLDFVMLHEILHIALLHCYRGQDRDNRLFNVATDIVVNSNIIQSCNVDISSLSLYHKYGIINKAPNKSDGWRYTAEEIYDLLLVKYGNNNNNSNDQDEDNNLGAGIQKGSGDSSFDMHDKWKDSNSDGATDKEDEWIKRIVAAATQSKLQGSGIPEVVDRFITELTEGTIDWKTALHEFIQTSTYDYSLLPPDRRFTEYDFFLPDLNDSEEEVSDILFFVDTSGSIDVNLLNEIFSEIKSAIEQFNGKLCGWLGFFDTSIYEPKKFENIEDLQSITPRGGGGTDFDIIFEYVNKEFRQEHKPKAVVILTDGYARFPKPEVEEVPTLWIICNSDVVPPFGKYIKRKI